MELSLSTFKTQVTALQQQLRALEKATRRQVKQLKKEASKSKNRGNRAPSGFAKAGEKEVRRRPRGFEKYRHPGPLREEDVEAW